MNRLPIAKALAALVVADALADRPLTQWDAADDAFAASPCGMAALELLDAADAAAKCEVTR